MIEVISVRFRGGCKTYYFDPQGISVQMGDNVVVETTQGLEFATCTQSNHEVPDESIVRALSPVLRKATEQDRRIVELNRKKESEAFDICEKKIANHKLDMRLVNVSASFDGNKIIFFFTADGRVDFRELVRDLASVFRARIELRQIGVRDEAKMIGGLGICGRPFCCSSFLEGFVPVSIKMAKTQNLSLNPAKISGTCGRLMCCLKYEQNAYEDAMKRMPKSDSFVQTPDGPGNVRSLDLLRETMKVSLDGVNEAPKSYHSSEIVVLRNGKGSREGIEIPRERPARYVDPKLDEARQEGTLNRPFYMTPESPVAYPTEEEFAPAQEERSRRTRPAPPRGNRRPRSGSAAQEEKESRSKQVPPRPRKPQPPKGQAPKGTPKDESKKPVPKKEGEQPRNRRPRTPQANPQVQANPNPQAPKTDAAPPKTNNNNRNRRYRNYRKPKKSDGE